MYTNVNRLELIHHNQGVTGNLNPNIDKFYCMENSDRYLVLARTNAGGPSKIRYWFLYEVSDDCKTGLGISENYILAKQPFEITITEQTYFEAHEVSLTGAKAIGIEVTDGNVDILISSNHLNISN